MSEIELHKGTPFLSTDELNRLARQQELSVVIAQAKIFDQICQEVNLTEEIEAELIQTFLQRQSINCDTELEEYLELRGWKEADLIYVATKAEKLRLFQEQMFSQEVELNYLSRKIDIDLVSYTLISVAEEDEAFELHQRLQEGEANPEELMIINNINNTSSLTTGLYGPQPISSSHSSLIPLLRVGHQNQLWPPFLKEGLWIIVKLNRREGTPLDDKLYCKLLDELFDNWVDRQVSRLITGEPLSWHPKPNNTPAENIKSKIKNIESKSQLNQDEPNNEAELNINSALKNKPETKANKNYKENIYKKSVNNWFQIQQNNSTNQYENLVTTWQTFFQSECTKKKYPEYTVPFKDIFLALSNLFPSPDEVEPKLQVFKNVLWIRHSGGLFDGRTGLVIPGTYMCRFPRQRQHPHLDRTWSDLIRPVNSYPAIDESVYLPFANASNFGHFATETIAHLWPYLISLSIDKLRKKPVLLNLCSQNAPFANVIELVLGQCGGIPIYDNDLPHALHLKKVFVPEPTLSLQSFVKVQHAESGKAIGDIVLAQKNEGEQMPSNVTPKIYISRSKLSKNVRKIDAEKQLEILLEKKGWFIFHPQNFPLKTQIFIYRQASTIAGFEGSALHGANFIGKVNNRKKIILLGDLPSLDYFLQFQAQEFDGVFIFCTKLAVNDKNPAHLRNRTLLLEPHQLAARIEECSRTK